MMDDDSCFDIICESEVIVFGTRAGVLGMSDPFMESMLGYEGAVQVL